MPDLTIAVILTAAALLAGFAIASARARRRERAAWQMLAEVCRDLHAVREMLERDRAAAPPVPESLHKIEALESELARRGLLTPEPPARAAG